MHVQQANAIVPSRSLYHVTIICVHLNDHTNSQIEVQTLVMTITTEFTMCVTVHLECKI